MSLDFGAELALTRFKGKKNTLRREFVLPDYVTHHRGRIRDPNAEPAATDAAPAAAAAAPVPPPRDAAAPPSKKKVAREGPAVTEQVLSLANERICVPELLFTPSDIGVEQAGLAECVVQAVDACPPDLRESLYANIVLTGGSTRFPNFSERLQRELRALVSARVRVRVRARITVRVRVRSRVRVRARVRF